MMKLEEQSTLTTEEPITNEASRADEGVRLQSRLKTVLARLSSDRSVRSGLFAFALTRAIIFTIFIMATQVSFYDNPPKQFGDLQNIRVSLERVPFARRMRDLVQRADGNWYLGIARDGYEDAPFDATREHNWAFFPAYPLVVRAAARLSGDYALSAMTLSNLFLLLALVLLHKTALVFGSDEKVADRAVLYAAAFPTSYFFSVAQTESLFLLLSVGCFYAARRERWLAAGLTGAIASATRAIGILLLPALIVLYLQRRRGKFRPWEVACLLLIPTGLLLFMLHLYMLTGNALAFKDVQVVWKRGGAFFLTPLYNFMMNPLLVGSYWDFRLLNFFAAIVALACGVILALRRAWALALYTLGCVLIPLSTSTTELQALTRYVMVVFPVFIVLAHFARRAWIDQLIRAIFFVLLGLMSAMYALNVSLALT